MKVGIKVAAFPVLAFASQRLWRLDFRFAKSLVEQSGMKLLTEFLVMFTVYHNILRLSTYAKIYIYNLILFTIGKN